jgi:hypothetical protein
MTEKRQTSQGYIIRILQHFATKLWNITNFVMLFQAVMKFLSRSKLQHKNNNTKILNSDFQIKISFVAYKSLKDLKYNLKNDTPEIYCIYFSMKRFVLNANNAERWSLPASRVYKLSYWRTYGANICLQRQSIKSKHNWLFKRCILK